MGLPDAVPELHLAALRTVPGGGVLASPGTLGPRLTLEVDGGARWTQRKLVGCGHVMEVPANTVQIQARGPMPCQLRLQAVHRVTMEPVSSAPLTVDGGPESELELALEMPRRWGQLGLLIFPEDDESARLTRLDGDLSPAVGPLADGALITAVDGIPVGHFSPEELVALDSGPLGSEVVLTVAGADGVEQDVPVEREVALLSRTRL